MFRVGGFWTDTMAQSCPGTFCPGTLSAMELATTFATRISETLCGTLSGALSYRLSIVAFSWGEQCRKRAATKPSERG